MQKKEYRPWPRDNPGPWTGVWLESVGQRDCSRYNADNDPNYYCTHLIASGHLRLITGNGVNVTLGPNDLFSMWPHIPCRFFAEPPCAGNDVEMDWIRLKGPLARQFMMLMGTSEDRPWARADDPPVARRLMRQLQNLAEHYPPKADLTAISLLYQLAAACCGPELKTQAARLPAERIREAMEQHVDSGMNVADFAKAFRMSQSNLFLLFKKSFKQSPIQVLTDIRLRRAKELLQKTNLTVKEIASSCGFRDPLYFSRLFHRTTGRPPRNFREGK